MDNISYARTTSPFPKTSEDSNSSKSPSVDLSKPVELAKFLERSVFTTNPLFSIADQDGCGQLSPASEKKILVLPAMSLCVGVAFHSKASGNWYALHCSLNDHQRPIQSFQKMKAESDIFECDKLLLINAPDVVNGTALSNQDVEPIAKRMLEKAGGTFNGAGVGHISCSWMGSFDERRAVLARGGNDDSPHSEDRRQVMIVPEAHSIYIFDENARHLLTYPL